MGGRVLQVSLESGQGKSDSVVALGGQALGKEKRTKRTFFFERERYDC